MLADRLHNLTDDQRAIIANAARELRSKIARAARAEIAGKAGGRGRPKNSLSDDSTDKLSTQEKQDNRKAVAEQHALPEKKVRHAAKLKKVDVNLYSMVRNGKITLNDGNKLSGAGNLGVK
jgi:hypothetical protein